MDLRQSPQYAKYMKLTGWVVEEANENSIYIRKIPLTPFSVIKVQRPNSPIPFKKIDQLAKKYRAVAIYLEPDVRDIRYRVYDIRKYGYRPSKSPFLPTKTIRLDLTQSEEKILAQMKKDARYGIRKAEGIAIKQLSHQAINTFHQAWKKSVNWRRWVPSLKSLKALKKSFGKNVIFLTSTHSNTLVYRTKEKLAGTVILIAGKTAYYYYAFSSKEGRKKFAQYLLVWEAIKSAKKRGCKIFDFEGIYDPRFPQKSWKGFSHFKKSFGGKEVKYPWCFVKYRLPF